MNKTISILVMEMEILHSDTNPLLGPAYTPAQICDSNLWQTVFRVMNRCADK
jgi:hypothetical protein